MQPADGFAGDPAQQEGKKKRGKQKNDAQQQDMHKIPAAREDAIQPRHSQIRNAHAGVFHISDSFSAILNRKNALILGGRAHQLHDAVIRRERIKSVRL